MGGGKEHGFGIAGLPLRRKEEAQHGGGHQQQGRACGAYPKHLFPVLGQKQAGKHQHRYQYENG